MKFIHSVLIFLIHIIFVNGNKKPNIIFIVADDLGWNDVGFHGSNQIPTPNIDALAYSGIILNNYYVMPVCTPSRAALMTGRHPIHTGMHHHVLFANEPWGLSLKEKILPEYLKEEGYVTRAVGKWHLGHFHKNYTPIYRGFDSHYGYWAGHQDYYDHTSQESLRFWGYDMRRNLNVSSKDRGKYSTTLFTEEAVDIISEHNTKHPLFLYVAHLAVHSANPYLPLQAPSEEVKKFNYIEDKPRRIYAAMLSLLDQSVGTIVNALHAREMLENSIIVFTTDNGGPAGGFNLNAASNWPLRGVKDTVWEGGIKGAAFVWSPLLKNTPRVSNQLAHIQDWLPTILSAANSSIKPKKLDGKNLWNALNDPNIPTYDELLINIDPIRNFSALRHSNWKLIKGTTWNGEFDRIIGPSGRNGSYDFNQLYDSLSARSIGSTSKPVPKETTVINLRNKATVLCPMATNKMKLCKPVKGEICLFDLDKDPCETTNLAYSKPNILKFMENILNEYASTMVQARNKPIDPTSNPKYWGYTWTNWRDYPPPPTFHH